MSNIKKEIESLRAKIARLESEQEKAEMEKKALANATSQIDNILKENGISFETYVRHNQKRIIRFLQKFEDKSGKPKTKPTTKKKTSRKRKQSAKTVPTIKIPAGKYGNLPDSPDQVFEVKEKGPRPKVLKCYAEEIGLEAFLSQCRLD
jgi:hypothetical protein